MKRWIAAIATCLAVCVWAPASAAPLPSLRIVTPAYTLECLPHMQGKTLELACVPAKTPARVADALERWRYGDPAPRGIFAQMYGTGGPVLCADTTLTCATGAVGINPAGSPTVANLTDSGLTASDTCVATSGAKQLIDGTGCASLSAANTWTALQTFNLAIAFPATTVTNPSIGVDGDSTGDLQLWSTINILAHSKIVLSNGLNASGGTFAGIGHLGSNSVCALTGTATSATSAGDTTCLITLASSAAAITFHTALTGTSQPICNGTDQTAAGPVKIAITGASNAWTGYTITAGTGVGASDVIAVHCIANGGS